MRLYMSMSGRLYGMSEGGCREEVTEDVLGEHIGCTGGVRKGVQEESGRRTLQESRRVYRKSQEGVQVRENVVEESGRL